MAEPAISRLPLEIATRGDLMRANREMKSLIDGLSQAGLVANRPLSARFHVSEELMRLAQENRFEINDPSHRAIMLSSLEKLKEAAPVIHISFASQPTTDAVKSIATWFRREVDPFTVLQVGVQPSIVAGCIVRTSNKVFNLSLGKRLESSRDILRERISAL